MAGIMSTILGMLKLSDDDDDDGYVDDVRDDDYGEVEPIVQTRKSKRDKPPIVETPRAPRRGQREEAPPSDSGRERFRGGSSKVVPIRTTSRGLEVCVLKPTSFEDSQEICDMLLSERAAVINLEGFDAEDAQRIMDFVSGCVYAINGKLHQIARYIFIISPESIDISGDSLEIAAAADASFGVPTLNRDY